MASASVVVFVYGGGWDSGREGRLHLRRCRAAGLGKGYVTVVPGLPASIRRCAGRPSFRTTAHAPVAWAKAHAADLRRRSRHRLFLMGHSAGAYNVGGAGGGQALAGQAVGNGAVAATFAGVVGHGRPLRLPAASHRRTEDHLWAARRRSGPTPSRSTMSTGADPPLFLATDTADKVVDPGNTTRMAGRQGHAPPAARSR